MNKKQFAMSKERALADAYFHLNVMAGMGRVYMYFRPWDCEGRGAILAIREGIGIPPGFVLANPSPIPLHMTREHARMWIDNVAKNLPVLE